MAMGDMLAEEVKRVLSKMDLSVDVVIPVLYHLPCQSTGIQSQHVT